MAQGKEFDGIEIPDNLLDSIAGGALSEDDKLMVRTLASLAKSRGYTIEDLVANLAAHSVLGDSADSITPQKIWDYIGPMWDEL